MHRNQIADRIYYDEPATLEFTAEVTAIRELARVDGKQVWQIALDRTAFYPTSGGQPHDTGALIATARSGASLEVPITDVEEDDAGEVWHTTAKPLQEGTAVRAVISEYRRRDHMQQHTGQHLLSAILDRDFGARTVSFHLGEFESTIDLEGPSLTELQMQSAEAVANAVVAQSLPLSVRYVSSEEAVAMKEQGLLRKLPPRPGNIRLVDIPGIDLNACGGTHVATTAEIGPVLLRGVENVRGNQRLSFVCGLRALRASRDDFQHVQSIARALTSSVDSISSSLERMKNEQRSQAKSLSALLEELAGYEAVRLAATSAQTVIHTLSAGRDAAYAKLLASTLIRTTAVSIALVATDTPEQANLVLAAKPGVIDCGTLLRKALAEHHGRGGGSPVMAQGAVAANLREDALSTLRAALP